MSDQAFDETAGDDPDRTVARAMTAATSAHALPAGAAAPNFRLLDRDSHLVGLLDPIADGPAAIHFHLALGAISATTISRMWPPPMTPSAPPAAI